MRELVFTVRYEHGADPVMDRFIEYPDLVSRSLSCHVTEETMWRLDRVVGPPEALTELDDIFYSDEHCNECLGSTHCHTEWQYEELSHDETSRVVYTYRPETGDCHSIPYHAARHLGDGLVVEAERRGDHYTWRFLLQSDRAVGDLYDALVSELREGLTLEVTQLTDSTDWGGGVGGLLALPYEQRVAVETAVEHGYYRTPRDISAEELAEVIGIPRSTLQYRLQRAESAVITRLVDED